MHWHYIFSSSTLFIIINRLRFYCVFDLQFLSVCAIYNTCIIDWIQWRQYLKCVKHVLYQNISHIIFKKTRCIFFFFILQLFSFFFQLTVVLFQSFMLLLLLICFFSLSLILCFFSLRLCFAMYVHLHYYHSENKPKYNNSLWTK